MIPSSLPFRVKEVKLNVFDSFRVREVKLNVFDSFRVKGVTLDDSHNTKGFVLSFRI